MFAKVVVVLRIIIRSVRNRKERAENLSKCIPSVRIVKKLFATFRRGDYELSNKPMLIICFHHTRENGTNLRIRTENITETLNNDHPKTFWHLRKLRCLVPHVLSEKVRMHRVYISEDYSKNRSRNNWPLRINSESCRTICNTNELGNKQMSLVNQYQRHVGTLKKWWRLYDVIVKRERVMSYLFLIQINKFYK